MLFRSLGSPGLHVWHCNVPQSDRFFFDSSWCCVVVRLIMMFFRGSEAFVLEVGAALHTEGAENGSEDSDDEINDFLDSFLFHVN